MPFTGSYKPSHGVFKPSPISIYYPRKNPLRTPGNGLKIDCPCNKGIAEKPPRIPQGLKYQNRIARNQERKERFPPVRRYTKNRKSTKRVPVTRNRPEIQKKAMVKNAMVTPPLLSNVRNKGRIIFVYIHVPRGDSPATVEKRLHSLSGAIHSDIMPR